MENILSIHRVKLATKSRCHCDEEQSDQKEEGLKAKEKFLKETLKRIGCNQWHVSRNQRCKSYCLKMISYECEKLVRQYGKEWHRRVAPLHIRAWHWSMMKSVEKPWKRKALHRVVWNASIPSSPPWAHRSVFYTYPVIKAKRNKLA